MEWLDDKFNKLQQIIPEQILFQNTSSDIPNPDPNLEILQKYKSDNFSLPENPSNQEVADFYNAFIGVLLNYAYPALQQSDF